MKLKKDKDMMEVEETGEDKRGGGEIGAEGKKEKLILRNKRRRMIKG